MLKRFVVVGLVLAFAGCGDNVQCPPSEKSPAPQASDPGAAPCTDIVLWMSPADDCVAAGGVYEQKVWPIVGGTAQMVCDFCGGGS